MIRNIVLDIGNVLVDFCWEKHIKSFGFPEEINERLAEAVFRSPAWNEMDRGVLDKEEIVRLFIRNDPEMEPQIRRITENVGGTIALRSYTETIIPELKGMGYRVYLLSNYSRYTLEDCGEKMHFLDQADGAILSYRYQIIKPDRRIYELLLEQCGLKADECLFFDDREDNVEGARKCGMHAEVFTGLPELFQVLKRYGN